MPTCRRMFGARRCKCLNLLCNKLCFFAHYSLDCFALVRIIGNMKNTTQTEEAAVLVQMATERMAKASLAHCKGASLKVTASEIRAAMADVAIFADEAQDLASTFYRRLDQLHWTVKSAVYSTAI